jgi:hypothetical protein
LGVADDDHDGGMEWEGEEIWQRQKGHPKKKKKTGMRSIAKESL